MKLKTPLLLGSFIAATVSTTLHAEDHQTAKPITEEMIIKAYGVDQFDDIECLKFTFNVSFSEKIIARNWTWYPKENRVILVDGEKTTDYQRDQISSEEEKAAESKFINDSFWLLWPVHLKWGTDDTLSETTSATDPLSGEDVTAVTLSYPVEGGGFTPGDKYILYLDQNIRATSWSYIPSGQENPKLTCTWDDYIQAGPLFISTKHDSESGSFGLTFTNVIAITE